MSRSLQAISHAAYDYGSGHYDIELNNWRGSILTDVSTPGQAFALPSRHRGSRRDLY